MLLSFELKGGLDALENCQMHVSHAVYHTSQKILAKHFEIVVPNDPLIQYLDQIRGGHPAGQQRPGSEPIKSDANCPEDIRT